MSAPGKRVRGRRALNLAAIYSLLFLNNGGLLIPPAIDVMATAFPHEPYSRVLLISTLPSLVALPFILLSGNLAGTRIRYRTLLLFVIPVYIISGTLPFSDRFKRGPACRAVYGVCFGLVGPLANALILRNYEGEDQIRFLGYGQRDHRPGRHCVSAVGWLSEPGGLELCVSGPSGRRHPAVSGPLRTGGAGQPASRRPPGCRTPPGPLCSGLSSAPMSSGCSC